MKTPKNPDSSNPCVAIPRDFFEHALPVIRDIAELQVMLATFRLIAEPAWSDGVVLETALLHDDLLRQSLHQTGAAAPPVADIQRGIDLAAARGTLLRFRVVQSSDEAREELDDDSVWLMPATPENQLRLTLMQRGEASLPTQLRLGRHGVRIEPERPNIFRLYEQNVGLVSPLIADQLIEAMSIYPATWIEDAIELAVSYNRRQWRYIQRILQRWATEGRGDEADRRAGHSGKGAVPERDLRGKYASIFRTDSR
ncbi:MAG TPA: DnaD domain protein [Thermomicrobiaceae bacterium]|nr:DnaD domain protein [Thermomicrobiaceae bacterium]